MRSLVMKSLAVLGHFSYWKHMFWGDREKEVKSQTLKLLLLPGEQTGERNQNKP